MKIGDKVPFIPKGSEYYYEDGRLYLVTQADYDPFGIDRISKIKNGSIRDFGLRTIKHRQSYAEWNDDKNEWDYVEVSCNCEICQEINERRSTV